MRPIRATLPLLALAACVAVSGCRKYDDPVGTVPSDDVAAPAAPGPDATGTQSPAMATDCDARHGDEREACLRGQTLPPTPVEPQQSPPAVPVER